MKPNLVSRAFVVSILLLMAATSAFADPARDEQRAQALYREVRCIQCQSESIADSEAPIALDMRRDIREAIASGQTDAQIRTRMAHRYSDYVLFRPRLSWMNIILWSVPPLMVALGVLGWFVFRKKQTVSETYELSAQEAEKLRNLLNKPD